MRSRKELPKPKLEGKPVTMTDIALDYAAHGLKVFPCHVARRIGFGCDDIACSCKDGVNCDPKSKGKHPRTTHGFRDASSDPAVIRAWWARWPDANSGITTGDGLLVVDVDPRKGGWTTLAKLEADHGPFPRVAAVVTGGDPPPGGLHFYYRYSGAPIGSGNDVLGPGIDVKCEDAYVIAPPSLHMSQRRYRWLCGAMPAKFPPAPAWLLKMARSGSARVAGTRRSATADYGPALRTADHPPGQRIAELIGAEDRSTYWKFNCPVHDDANPSAAMYPRAGGQVYFKCFAGCVHSEIADAFKQERRA